MKTTSLVPAVLLLTLSAPTFSSTATSAPAMTRFRTRAANSAVDVRPDALWPENIVLVGQYLARSSGDGSGTTEARTAWDAFYPRCDQTIRAFAARYFKSTSDIDDCAQEVWIDLVRNLPEFTLDQSRGRFSSWLFTIVRNKAIDMARRQARKSAEPLTVAVHAHPDNSVADPADALDRKLDVHAVRDALTRLKSSTSDENYRILHLRHVEGRDVADVAAILNIAPQQVWAREHRLKRRLKSILARNADLNPNADLDQDADATRRSHNI